MTFFFVLFRLNETSFCPSWKKTPLRSWERFVHDATSEKKNNSFDDRKLFARPTNIKRWGKQKSFLYIRVRTHQENISEFHDKNIEKRQL